MAHGRAGENYLVISDLQIPFEAEKALDFCLQIKRDFKINDKNVLCVGDEVDQYFGSLYAKDPDARHTATSEINDTIKVVREWGKAFPDMLIAESNHGQRWAKKAAAAEIPSIMMRKYQEIIQAPPGWKWRRSWLIDASKQKFLLTHGMGYSGMYAHRQMALNNGISTVHGHLTHAGISHIKTEHQEIWGMCVAALIDVEAYAFHYGKDHKFKPSLGAGVVLDGGRTPIWLPYS